ncbi:MAG: S8 family serine peptidase, partial [Chthonomonadales bacterium]|nr:S8 family serine peptidase [Chthonomonadales bacterium]
LGSPSSTGGSPRSITANFTATAARRYTTYLSRSSGTVSLFAVTGTTTYAGVGDGFNALSGVAPGCWWVGHKVYGDDGSGGDTGVVSYALDECIAYNTTYNIKVINLSLSTGSAYSPIRNKVNTCAANGMIVTVSAGNSGPSGIMTDPARARLAITASASSDINQLADYPSNGGFTQESNTDYKPDLAPPGGSKYQTHILSVDANQSDAGSPSFADQYANDYTNTRGTSMSAPHAAGVAALVINALEAGGLTWSFTSDEHPRLVKMLLCATATETNTAREGGMNNPTLGRAAAPRDNYEGYGLINCDAAIEAAYQTLAPGATINDTTAGGQFDRRAWGRRVALTAGVPIHLDLTVPDGADYDLYLYYGGGTPDPQGLPVILASSTSPSTGADETIDHTPASSETAYVVIKRISGGGAWSLHYPSAMGITVISPNGGETWQLGTTHTIQWSYSGALGPNVRIELLRSGSPIGTIASSVSIGSGGSGSYSWTIPIGFGASSTDTIRITSVETPAITDTSDSAFSLTRIPTTLYTVDRVGIITERITLKAYDLKRTTDNALLPSQTITFRIDGTAVGTATTDAGGDAALNWDITEGPSTRTIKAEFDQDASYLGSSHTATLTAQSWTTKIATFDRTQRISGRTELKARLLRSDNVPLYNKSIDFSVDG